MTRIGIILGSTRDGRNGEPIAKWVEAIASRREDAEFELLDLLDYPLPARSEEWASAVESFDGFVIVAPEYDGRTSGVLQNAIDAVQAEWSGKAVGFVSYGWFGGAGAAKYLRRVVRELRMIDVPLHLELALNIDFKQSGRFKPRVMNLGVLVMMLNQLVPTSAGLATTRRPSRST